MVVVWKSDTQLVIFCVKEDKQMLFLPNGNSGVFHLHWGGELATHPTPLCSGMVSLASGDEQDEPDLGRRGRR